YEVDNYCNCDGFCNGGHGTHTEYCKGDLVITVYCIGADEISDPNLTNFHWLDPMFAIDDIGSSGTIEESELIADDFTIKYYCGDTYNHECNNGINFGIGSTGKVLTANKSIAVDPTLIPIGTHVMINGKEYIAEDDKGGTIAGHEIYIYVGSHTEVIAKGSQLNQKVYWLRDVAATKDFEGWTNNNKEWAWNIFRQNWVEIYGIGIGGGTFISSPILEEELETIIDKIKANFPALTSQREALIRNGLQLVGRVPYFWGGGHHSALSPDVDPAWGTEYRIISAAGYSGQPLGSSWPYGLDCSGFTRWVILATTGTDSMWAGAIGQRVSMGSLPISSSELLPGDFANTSNDGHVGIYLYTDTDGKMVFLHCSPSVDGVGINKP
ncbi:MAG: C40 family peptidase, partial [Lactobacillus sp.]|nr:C40 family peptidase [Lactobacillus sp.]